MSLFEKKQKTILVILCPFFFNENIERLRLFLFL